jgi:hypothetical protein
MHDEHIFLLLLSHDLQNLAFIFSHQAQEAVSGGRKPLLTQVSLTYKFQTGKAATAKKTICIYVCIYIYIRVTFFNSKFQQKPTKSCIELNIK